MELNEDELSMVVVALEDYKKWLDEKDGQRIVINKLIDKITGDKNEIKH